MLAVVSNHLGLGERKYENYWIYNIFKIKKETGYFYFSTKD